MILQKRQSVMKFRYQVLGETYLVHTASTNTAFRKKRVYVCESSGAKPQGRTLCGWTSKLESATASLRPDTRDLLFLVQPHQIHRALGSCRLVDQGLGALAIVVEDADAHPPASDGTDEFVHFRGL